MILFSKLKKSTASVRKSDLDEHYQAHRKHMQHMSKADKISMSINLTSPTSQPISKSPSKGYITS